MVSAVGPARCLCGVPDARPRGGRQAPTCRPWTFRHPLDVPVACAAGVRPLRRPPYGVDPRALPRPRGAGGLGGLRRLHLPLLARRRRGEVAGVAGMEAGLPQRPRPRADDLVRLGSRSPWEFSRAHSDASYKEGGGSGGIGWALRSATAARIHCGVLEASLQWDVVAAGTWVVQPCSSAAYAETLALRSAPHAW